MGTTTLDRSFSLTIFNKQTELKHEKGRQKSFESRNIRGADRKHLGEKVADMAFPSKYFHRKLASLDEKSFSMGNLRDVPQSKSVVSQCSYEYRKRNQIDPSPINSLKELKLKYSKELNSKCIPGFIQFFTVDPLTVALWGEKDIELFDEMSKNHCLLVDATGTITLKLNDKEILYFSFISFDRSLKTEPVPHLEILTDRSTTNTLKFVLSTFLEDETKRYRYTTHSVPILCITDVSWPIIKCLVESFHKETLEQFICRSYRISSGNASIEDLPTISVKTFVHISLCHAMKAFARKIGKCFKKEKYFMKYCMSLLANAGTLSDIIEICENIFKVLLSKSISKCSEAKQFLDIKIATIETFIKESLVSMSSMPSSTSDKDSSNMTSETMDMDRYPVYEETYLQQSKRSIYYKTCKAQVDKIKHTFEQKDIPLDSALECESNCSSEKDINIFYSPSYAEYFLNN